MKGYAVVLFFTHVFLAGTSVFPQEPTVVLPIGHSRTVFFSAFSPDGKKIITASHDQTVKMWDITSGYLLIDIPNTSITCAPQFSPDGKNFVTASFTDGSITIWSASTGVNVLTIPAHKEGVTSLCYSSDGKKIATASWDSSAKIWDAQTGGLLLILKADSKWGSSCSFSNDDKKILTTGTDISFIRIWDAASGNMITEFRNPESKISAASFSPDGKKVASSSFDGVTQVWNAETGSILAALNAYSKKEIAAEFSPDGTKILTLSKDSTIKLWTLTADALVPGFREFGTKISFATFSPDGRKIIGASYDGTARIWDLKTGSLLHTLTGHSWWINHAAFSADGKKISTSSWDNSAIVWNTGTGKLMTSLKGHTEAIAVANISPDGKKFVTASWNNNARIWDIRTGKLLYTLKGHQSRVISAFFSPDGKRVITSSWDKTAKVWDAQSGKLMMNLDAGGKYQLSLAQYSYNGKKIITYSEDSTLKIWNPADGSFIDSFRKPANNLSFIRFTDAGAKVLTIAKDTSVNVWDLNKGSLVASLKGHESWIMSARFSPDFKKVVSASWDKTVRIWNTETGKLLHTINAPGGFSYAEFSPDGTKIVASCLDGTVSVWNAETATPLLEMKCPRNDVVRGSRFSIDGKKIIAITGNNVRVWNAETGQLLGDLTGHQDRIASAVFSPDGKIVLTASWDRLSRLWNAETGEMYYSSFAVDDADYLVQDKFNHYDGTAAARKMIYLNCSGEVIELDQIKDQLWVPDLAQRIMDGETINAAKLSDLNICNLTPVVDTLGQKPDQYGFRITPRDGGLSTVILYVNNIEVKRYDITRLQLQKNSYLLNISKKELASFFVPGKENTVSVKALTAKNSISSRSVSINEKKNNKNLLPPNLYAIVVGISDYKGDDLDLKFAAKDAADMAAAIDLSAKKLLNTDGKEHVYIYKVHTAAGRDKFPEKNSIRQLFTDISMRAQPNDILLLFFAGHGVVEADKNQFYFLTADASNATVSGALKNVGISTEEIAEWIKPQVMKAQKRILIFDACNSGQALKEMISFTGEGKNMLASRGDDKGKQIKAIEKLNEKSGMFILSASASDQKAYEMSKYNQGVLTYTLLKAIKEQPDILEDRQYLNISRWFNAAEKSVNELARETGARQQPQLVSTSNFNIGVVDDDVRNKIILPADKPLFTKSEFRNTEMRIDNLKLRNLVDKELEEIATGDINSLLLYSPEYEGASVLSVSGDYTVTGDNITVSVLIIKGGTEIKTKFEIKGTADKPRAMAKLISVSVTDWIKKQGGSE